MDFVGEVVNVAQLMGLSPKCGSNYILCYGLVDVWVEQMEIVPEKGLSLNFDMCTGGNKEMVRGIYSPCTTKNAVWHLTNR